MKVKKNININLSEDEVKQVIIDYLKKDGYEVIITHGNGPQVGMISLAMHAGNISDNFQ